MFQLREGGWLLSHTYTGDDAVEAPPFEALSFPLRLLTPFDPPETAG